MSMFSYDSVKSCVPDRIYVKDSDGGFSGVPANFAEKVLHIKPDIIFFRRDGWTLGATRGETDVDAFELWKGEWEGYLLLNRDGSCPDKTFHSISDFRKM